MIPAAPPVASPPTPKERPDSFRSSVRRVVESGAVTLLDLAVVRRSGDGIEILELDTIGDTLRLTEIEPPAQGLIGDEDLEALAAEIPDGGTTVAIAIEHTWAREVVGAVLSSGAEVVAAERIPADVVNTIADLAELQPEAI